MAENNLGVMGASQSQPWKGRTFREHFFTRDDTLMKEMDSSLCGKNGLCTLFIKTVIILNQEKSEGLKTPVLVKKKKIHLSTREVHWQREQLPF